MPADNTRASDSSYPRGIPYIIGNEAAERFSYYGMRTILVVFMTTLLMDRSGKPAPMSEPEAVAWYHVFSAANYFFPIFGAVLSDLFWGKYRTIILLSLVYCAGHLALAIDDTRTGLALGLFLIAFGSGGIKPCVSAHVGDQFTIQNVGLLHRVFGYFYIAINLGAAISSLLTPYLLEHYGPHLAFAVPGLLMAVATLVFWQGRNHFVALPPVPWAVYRQSLLSTDGRKAVKHLGMVFIFVAIFWSLYDQSGSSWVLQAEHMNRRIDFGFGISFELLASQLQALNPLLILILVPFFSGRVYPFFSRRFSLTSQRKILMGMLLMSVTFVISAYAQFRLDTGYSVSILWQAGAYVVLTISEVMVSVTAMEYAYTQAPLSLKSFLMSFYLLSVSLGNAVTAAINFLIMRADGSSYLSPTNYFLFFAGLMLLTSILFALFSRGYQERCIVRTD